MLIPVLLVLRLELIVLAAEIRESVLKSTQLQPSVVLAGRKGPLQRCDAGGRGVQ